MKKVFIILALIVVLLFGGCQKVNYVIIVDNADIRISTEEEYRLLPIISPEYHDAKFIFTSSNHDIITVNKNGVIVPIAPGKAAVEIALQGTDTAIAISVEVYALKEEAELRIIGVTEVEVGARFTLSAYWGDGAVAVDWEISNEILAAINPGCFLAVAVGPVTVKAILKDNPKIWAKTEIVIVPGKLEISLMPNDDIWPGKNGYFLIAKKMNGLAVKAAECKYESADPEIATVNQLGQITAYAWGTTTITVTGDYDIGTYMLTVKDLPLENLRNTIVAIAIGENGFVEGANNDTKYGDWYGLPNQPWCAMFVSWCAYQAGIPPAVIPKYASVQIGLDWYRTKGSERYKTYNETQTDDYIPQCGDIIFFKSNGASHTGLVIKTIGDKLYTIEGNTSNQIAFRWYYYKNYDKITGYGIPDYPPTSGELYDFDISLAKYGGGLSTQ